MKSRKTSTRKATASSMPATEMSSASLATEAAAAGLRSRSWKRFLRGPDPALLEELYVPALAAAVRYDRCCSYFSSSVLSAAARGFGGLIERLLALGDNAPRPAIRLVVNEELPEADVRAMTETRDLSALEAPLKKRFRKPKDVLEKQRLAMLGWLVKESLLEVKVGVMRYGEGIVHAKFGIVTDEAEDALVFSGSGNESARGLMANYERLEVSTSWEDEERHEEYSDEFSKLWSDSHEDVHTVSLPEALRLKLIKFAPEEPPVAEPSEALARQKAAMLWRCIVEAAYFPNGAAACDATAMVEAWPHQKGVVEETAAAWPDGRLLCDEVGMGKTIEAILVLRRLMAGRGVRRVLVLLPAGLVKQWQAELREKGGLIFPRLEGTTTLVWPDGQVERVENLARALDHDSLLMSRETARTEHNLPILLEATPWDLVVLDETHAARRRRQEEGEFNSATLLLSLLRQLQLRRRARGLLLLSATPMQTQPWEPWDLLAVLGEGGAWLADFATVRNFYRAANAVEQGRCDLETARAAAVPVSMDPQFPPPPGAGANPQGIEDVSRALAFAAPSKRAALARWLRQGSPLARRMHRNTRATLRGYYEMGLLPAPPPVRHVEDIRFDYEDSAERHVYNAVSRYIDARFHELEAEKPGKGFVMTIYRRRASSSPFALERSLERRRSGLLRVIDRRAYDSFVREEDEDLDPRDLDDVGEIDSGGRVSMAFPTDPQVARTELREVDQLLGDLRALRSRDSKRGRFFDELRRLTDDGRPILVFTEYVDTLEYIRDSLEPLYGEVLGCYSGEGGKVWDGSAWMRVSKDQVTGALHAGDLRIVLCTDAASEGLNLQAAGALINYDLPWNPSKVEQRIGRIDRIGQPYPNVRVVNLFLKDSIDERVYGVLRMRCGLFEQFVGPMQPVLARARRMLLGQEGDSREALEATAEKVEAEPLAREAYAESDAEEVVSAPAPLTRADIVQALKELVGEFGPRARLVGDGLYRISGIAGAIATDTAALEREDTAAPLSPLMPQLRKLADQLDRHGERLPLVVGSYQIGPFRSSAAYWVGSGVIAAIESVAELRRRLESWNGLLSDPGEWLDAQRIAKREAEKAVRQMEQRARQREQENLRRQKQAARLRLQRELGRYLVCLGAGTADLNSALYQQMSRDIASAVRLRKALEKFGDYPEWPAELCRDLEVFYRELTGNQRRARLLGTEIDAALDDPRWLA